MLSRIAESMFWIGRYVERAEDTARILDVQTQLLLEDASVDESQTCRDLLSIMGIEPEDAADRLGIDITHAVGIEQVLRLLAYDMTSPSSIAAAVGAARESARRAREILSVPLWEVINTTYLSIPSGRFNGLRPPYAFQWVRERAALINGTADATMTRDEGWHFLMLGRCIERADMTSRLIAATSLSGGSVGAVGQHPAGVRRLRGIPPHLPRVARRSARPRSSCCSTDCSRGR